MENRFIYCSREKINLYSDGKSVPIESQYLQSYKKNMVQINRKKEWKEKSDLTLMGRYSSPRSDVDGLRYSFTGATFVDTDLIYSIQIENSSGMFKARPAIVDKAEGHIVHNTDRSYHSPSYSSARKEMVYSVKEGGVENLHLQNLAKETERELTEGDSFDANPRWDLAGSNRIVYQTAGIGRDQQGNFAMLGPWGINILDFENNDVIELSYSHSYDYIFPVLHGKRLFAIRRPYETFKRKYFSPLDLIMIPINMIRTLFSFINFSSMMFRGKPLSDGMAVKDPAVEKKIFIHGRMVDAEKAMKASRKFDTANPSVVPRSWVLVEIDSEGRDTVLEEGVTAFDVQSDGSILFSNGSAIYHRPDGGKRRLLFKEKWVEQIIVPR